MPHDPASEATISATSSSCARCDGVGFYKLAVPFGHADFGMLFPCECKQVERAERHARQHARLLGQLADDLGELRDCTLPAFDLSRAVDDAARASLANALRVAHDYVEYACGSLYFYGPTGVGKSHLAAGIALEVAASGRSVSYTTEPSLMRFLRAGYDRKRFDDTDDTDQRMLALQAVDLLVLDDLGTAYRAKDANDARVGWVDAQLFDLLHQRFLHDRATIMTSNLHPDDLEARIRSRIKRAAIVEIDNSDQRERSEVRR